MVFLDTRGIMPMVSIKQIAFCLLCANSILLSMDFKTFIDQKLDEIEADDIAVQFKSINIETVPTKDDTDAKKKLVGDFLYRIAEEKDAQFIEELFKFTDSGTKEPIFKNIFMLRDDQKNSFAHYLVENRLHAEDILSMLSATQALLSKMITKRNNEGLTPYELFSRRSDLRYKKPTEKENTRAEIMKLLLPPLEEMLTPFAHACEELSRQ